MSTATQAQNVASVGDYNSTLSIINQEWSGSGATGIPNTAARLYIAMAIAGIPITNHQALANLVAQSNLEYPSGPVGNNLLGTSLQVNGSTSTNSSGVQSYKQWQDGVYATAKMLQQQNMSSMFTALYNNVSAKDYATALANSTWEGGTPGDSANTAYGASFLSRYNQLNANGTLGSMIKSGISSDPGVLSPQGQAGQATPGLNASGPFGALISIAEDLLNGFGIGWKAVLTIIGGIMLIGIGILIVFRREAAQAAEAAV